MQSLFGTPTGTITETIRGIVDRVTYHNPDNGWSVLRLFPFNSPSQQETVIVHQTKVFAGATMEFQGAWTTHPKFGRQFKATKAIKKKPAVGSKAWSIYFFGRDVSAPKR
jgi:exodeoxyribonuclease V alpha subunit